MNTADLITAFFNNEMSPDQERQFLVSVASSDSLRLGLKSHVMLDKILNEQSDITRVSPNVRTNIMREAAVVAAAATGLSASDAFAHETGTSDPTAASEGSRAFLSRWLSTAAALLVAVGSFFAGFYTGSETSDAGLQNATVQEADAMQERDAVLAPLKVPATSPALVAGGNNDVVEAEEGSDRNPGTQVAGRADRTGGNTVATNIETSEPASVAEGEGANEATAQEPAATATNNANKILVNIKQHTAADTTRQSDNQNK